MRKCRNKIDYDRLSPVEIYQSVLSGKIKRFPNGFWKGPDGEENSIEILRYLFESVLQWSSEDIKKNYYKQLYTEYKLQGMLSHFFNGSPFQALNAVYPNQFKEWELKFAPNKFWNKETGIQATKWLIEEKLKWTKDDIKEKLSQKVFINNGLRGMLSAIYHDSPWQAINAAYPNQFKEWELPQTCKDFWNDATALQATKWLIEEKLKWTENDIKEKLSQKTFINNRLFGVLRIYNGSPWKAINSAYPNQFQFKEWEIQRVPNNFWNETTGIQATRWLIEEKLKWTENEIKEHLRVQIFCDYGLSRMIRSIYNNNLYETLNKAYPGRFQRSDFQGRTIQLLKHQPDELPAHSGFREN